MTIEAIRDRIPDYARDIRLNLGSVLTTQGAPGLNEAQVWMTALASAIAARNAAVVAAIVAHERQLNGHGFTREAVQSAVRIAAVIHAVAGVLDYEAGRGAVAAAA